METTLAALVGVALVTLAGLSRRQSVDLGTVPDWTDQKAQDATSATVRYLGASYEHARLVDAQTPTTREWARVEREAVIAEREERLRAMTRPPAPALRFQQKRRA